jgi:HAE1 family hydrophobic/amphiphilic exporter-1
MFRAAEISGAPAEGYSSADALNALEEVAATLPKELGIAWSNMSYQEKAAEGTGGTDVPHGADICVPDSGRTI